MTDVASPNNGWYFRTNYLSGVTAALDSTADTATSNFYFNGHSLPALAGSGGTGEYLVAIVYVNGVRNNTLSGSVQSPGWAGGDLTIGWAAMGLASGNRVLVSLGKQSGTAAIAGAACQVDSPVAIVEARVGQALDPLAPVGLLDDFGAWASGKFDTAITHDPRSGSQAAATNTTTGWAQSYAVASRPIDYYFARGSGGSPDRKLWRAAAYAAASVRFTGVAATERNLITEAVVEKVPPMDNVLGPEASSSEEEMAYFDSSTASVLLVDSVVTAPYFGDRTLQVTVTDTTTDPTYTAIPEIGMAKVENTDDTFSAWIRVKSASSLSAKVRLTYYNYIFGVLGTEDGTLASVTSDWSLISAVGTTVPANTCWVSATVVIDKTTAAVGNVLFVDDVRIRKTTALGPSVPYTEARSVWVTLIADAINYVRDAIPNDASHFVGINLTGTKAMDSTTHITGGTFAASLKVNPAAGDTGWGVRTVNPKDGLSMIDGLRPDAFYTASVWCRKSGTFDASLQVVHHDTYTGKSYATQLAATPTDTDFVDKDAAGNTWVRLTVPFYLPSGKPTHGPVVTMQVVTDGTVAAGTETMWLNGWMIHEGGQPFPFFEFSMNTTDIHDYIGEYGDKGTLPPSFWGRTHRYPGYSTKISRVWDIITQNVGAGLYPYVLFARMPSRKRILRDVFGRPIG